ncbi:hypothetical protein GCM10011505_46000 [Tistrella bauzanensis]|uniref:Ribonuclease PH n=1 Tax=Tistrella bauzanensis TaxID=657419 RepID=A0ABQ1J7R3_9PROT|nr:hypothetical protein GCM10011505_46000 [Tistrella bauzanensis]
MHRPAAEAQNPMRELPMRLSGRAADALRVIRFEPMVNKYAEGSCLVHFGDTKVLVTASVEEKVPPFLRNTGKGWVTAEYGMLPRATHSRTDREAAKGKQQGRTVEIQRLIGRSLRAVVDMQKLGERQVRVDADVIQADGGTRTASITGGYVALWLALQKLVATRDLAEHPITRAVAAISCGLVDGEAVLDLDYEEDSRAEADANFVLAEGGGIVEVQATAEADPFSPAQFRRLVELAEIGTARLFEMQKEAILAAMAGRTDFATPPPLPPSQQPQNQRKPQDRGGRGGQGRGGNHGGGNRSGGGGGDRGQQNNQPGKPLGTLGDALAAAARKDR